MLCLSKFINGVGTVRVYHGTQLCHAMDIIENGVNLSKSNMYLDFGKGFYLTPDISMAKNMAKRVLGGLSKTKKAFPTVMSFEYKENPELSYKIFDNEDIEWAKFIMANRVTPEIARELCLSDSNSDFKYDIVIGGTADGNVARIASDLRYGRLQPKQYSLKLSDFLKQDGSSYGTQIVLCTKKSISCIEYIKCDII